jgi:uncharacterized protein with NAD-binding domain and iron-sulfur cluster
MIETDVIIVGGGLSGLACARALQEHSIDFHLLEDKSALGGRVRTDVVDGFLVDRGFQVLNDAYPAVHRLVDLSELNLGAFAPGAEILKNGRMERIGDPLRNFRDLLPTLRASIATLKDKLLILRLVAYCHDPGRRSSVADLSTEEFLVGFGFSPKIIECFFRPFFGGVFLEESLLTSAAKFLTHFAYFSQGRATLPAGGMQALPESIGAPLEPERLHLSEGAREFKKGKLTTDRDKYRCKVLVLAGWQGAATLLSRKVPLFHRSHTLAFCLPQGSSRSNYIHLNGSSKGVIQSVAFNSAAQPSYAPPGRDLAMVVTRTECDPEQVRKELQTWYGAEIVEWELLTQRLVRTALPQEPNSFTTPPIETVDECQVLECGDHTETGSIQGALSSGLRAAQTARALLA